MYNHQIKTGVLGTITVPKTKIRKYCELCYSAVLKMYYWVGIPGLFSFFASKSEAIDTVESDKRYYFELENI